MGDTEEQKGQELKTDERTVYLDDLGTFDLSRLWNVFEIAEFERKVYSHHIMSIRNAIMNRRLIDFVVTVFRLKDSQKWMVIDGQHRLIALDSLYQEQKLKSYPITIRVINAKTEKEAREIYLGMNSGKPLTNKDILKSYDTGHVYFFNELRSIAAHDGGKNKMKFSDCLGALYYVKKLDGIRKNKIESALNSVENWEVVRMKTLLDVMLDVSGGHVKRNIFYSTILRSVSRLYFEEFKTLNEKKWKKFIESLEEDQTVKANKTAWRVENIEMLYDYLTKKWDKMK